MVEGPSPAHSFPYAFPALVRALAYMWPGATGFWRFMLETEPLVEPLVPFVKEENYISGNVFCAFKPKPDNLSSRIFTRNPCCQASASDLVLGISAPNHQLLSGGLRGLELAQCHIISV